ncbi:MAG: hypothetical protein LBC60_00600 [Spirochaetaceae bacterium]|jgi:hypothetical protein|nr:hypothetical protein [Spirochaetaceae bacterium]
MAGFSIHTLDLRAPLFYTPWEDASPFAYNPSDGELLFCFDLDPAQYRRFEPEEPYLGPLIFKGKATPPFPAGVDWFQLPRGTYLFAQMREILTRDQWIAMAMDLQQEGLWRRLQPESRLYLRYLYEDGQAVTQVWRPFTGSDSGS